MIPVIRARARDDIIRQFRWYLVEQDAANTAFRFVDAVEDSVKGLSLMSHMGTARRLRNPTLQGLLVWPVKDFEEFLIFYLLRGDTILIIRILHGKRDINRILKGESIEDDAWS